MDVLKHLPLPSTPNDVLQILEVGCGIQSVFNNIELSDLKVEVNAIDFCQTAIDLSQKFNTKKNISYYNKNISSITDTNCFDCVVDAHCLHCIPNEDDYHQALNNIYHSLKRNGIFALETMVAHKKMSFDDGYHFCRDTKILWKEKVSAATTTTDIPVRRIEDCLSLEQILLSIGFQIIYFICPVGFKVIPTETRNFTHPYDPDLLRVVCRRILN